MSPDVLVETVQNFRGFSPSGRHCSFIKLSDEWGIKVYLHRSMRDDSYTRQNDMATIDCAPPVGIKFDAGNKYCFLTEFAEPLLESAEGEDYWENYYEMDDTDEGRFLRDKMAETTKKMREIGDYRMDDDHFANFGWYKGKVVCIDFGA